MLGLNYGPDEEDPLSILKRRDRGAISVYARSDDYHEIIKPRLKTIARWLVENGGGDVKVFIDTAAVMEKPLAQQAGLGWQGKHTNLSRANTARGSFSARSSRRWSCPMTLRTKTIAGIARLR
jgi:epoxyqueuosine reductase